MKGTITTYYPRRRHKLNQLGDSLGYDTIEFDILKTNNLKAILNKTDKNKPCHNLYLKGNFTYAEGVWIKGNKLTT